MLKALRNWVNDLGSSDDEELEKARAEEERRLDKRHDFSGAQVGFRDRRAQSVIHLKDMSCKGASGISDLPIAVGSLVFIEIRKNRFHAAEVRWVRNSLIGLRFHRPFQPEVVEKFHADHVARLARTPRKARR